MSRDFVYIQYGYVARVVLKCLSINGKKCTPTASRSRKGVCCARSSMSWPPANRSWSQWRRNKYVEPLFRDTYMGSPSRSQTMSNRLGRQQPVMIFRWAIDSLSLGTFAWRTLMAITSRSRTRRCLRCWVAYIGKEQSSYSYSCPHPYFYSYSYCSCSSSSSSYYNYY